jgi:hypothetical protein
MIEEEKYNLDLYRDRVQELISSRFLKDENFIKFLNGEKPDEEQIISLLSKYRFFYLQNEPTNFYKICNILFKNAKNEKKKESIRNIRETYKKILEGGIGFVFSDKLKAEQPPKDNIDLWFNSFYFHSDKDKREQLEKLQKGYGYIQKFVLIREIWGLVLLIKQLNEIVEEVIKQSI